MTAKNGTIGRSILFSEMTPPSGREREFNAWYDDEHIPIRMAVPGFCGAQRYREVAADTGEAAPNAAYLAVYDTQDIQVFSSPAYDVVKKQPSELTRDMLANVTGFTRYLATEISREVRPGLHSPEQAQFLYAVWFDVPSERLADFDAWYEKDHVPTLMESSDWMMVRRFHVVDGAPARGNRLALHYLADVAGLESDARAKARASTWRARLAIEPWFKGRYQVFARHGERFYAKTGS